jgi:hypothetical protein
MNRITNLQPVENILLVMTNVNRSLVQRSSSYDTGSRGSCNANKHVYILYIHTDTLSIDKAILCHLQYQLQIAIIM